MAAHPVIKTIIQQGVSHPFKGWGVLFNNSLIRVSCMILLCVGCSCDCTRAVESKFYIDSVEMRLVDVVSVDQYGCISLDSFELNRGNEYCAVGFLFKKVFYLDKDTDYVRPFMMGQAPKGMRGAKSTIDSVVVEFLSRNNERVNMTDAFSANPTFLGVEYQSAKFDRMQEYIGQGECSAYEEFSSIRQFVENFNDNTPSVRGEGLGPEILFFLKKEDLLNKVESPLSMLAAVRFRSQKSFEYNRVLQN